MKKTLIALATLASIGSAFADVTIVPYARVDLGVSNTTQDGKKDTGLVVGSGGYNSSLFGLKGETDLGNGMKGFAKVEQWMDPTSDTGFTGGGYSRTGIIGLSGSFGSLQLGNDFGPYDYAIDDAMQAQHLSPSSTGGAWGAGAHFDGGNAGATSGNVQGAIQYTSPSMGGFSGMLAIAPKKDKVTGNDLTYSSGALFYSAGPLNVSAGFEHVATIQGGNFANATDGYTDAYAVTGSYNLGPAAVYLGFNHAKVNGTQGATGSDTDDGYAIGVKVPMGQITFGAGYANEKTSGTDMNQKADSYGLQALYAINKQFTAYGGVLSTKVTPDVGSSVTKTKTAVGLTMSF